MKNDLLEFQATYRLTWWTDLVPVPSSVSWLEPWWPSPPSFLPVSSLSAFSHKCLWISTITEKCVHSQAAVVFSVKLFWITSQQGIWMMRGWTQIRRLHWQFNDMLSDGVPSFRCFWARFCLSFTNIWATGVEKYLSLLFHFCIYTTFCIFAKKKI